MRLARIRLGSRSQAMPYLQISGHGRALFLAISTLQDHNAPNGIASKAVAAAAVLVMHTKGDAAGAGATGAATTDAQHLQGSERGGAQHHREAAA